MMLNGELAMENAGNLVYSEEDNALLLMDTVTDLSNAHAIISHLENFVNRQESLIQVLQ
ncbi:chaperone SicP, partial [Salmonella enterica subsp. enterica]|nr:chaperone SicP [Salmonella enterica subsp. enterica serovar Miami]